LYYVFTKEEAYSSFLFFVILGEDIFGFAGKSGIREHYIPQGEVE